MLCVKAYPASTPAPKPQHSLLRMRALPRTLSILYTLNTLAFSWFEYTLPSGAAVPPTYPGMTEPLHTLRWWISNLLFLLTDSPPTSGSEISDDIERERDGT